MSLPNYKMSLFSFSALCNIIFFWFTHLHRFSIKSVQVFQFIVHTAVHIFSRSTPSCVCNLLKFKFVSWALLSHGLNPSIIYYLITEFLPHCKPTASLLQITGIYWSIYSLRTWNCVTGCLFLDVSKQPNGLYSPMISTSSRRTKMVKCPLLILKAETNTAGTECVVEPPHSSRPQTTPTPLPKPSNSLVWRNKG